MGFTKPNVQVDWINDDSATKYTIPSAGDQLAGHLSGTNADPKIFNWLWWRVSQWIEFLDNTFDSNGNEVNAPNSTKITETVSPTISTVTLDAGGIKSWDGSSNAIFSVTEAGVVTLGYSGNDIISLNAGVISVCTATSTDLVKLHALTPSAADLNKLLGADGNGLVIADITKLANIDASDTDIDVLNGSNAYGLVVSDIQKLADIDASAAEIDQLDGVSVGGSSAGDIVTIDDTQTLTNKTISFSQIYSGTAAAGRTFTITGHDTTPANFAFQGSSRYTRVSCDAAGTEMSILPSATNTVALAIGSSTYRYSSIDIYSSSSGININTSGNIVATAGSDDYTKIEGGSDSAGNNYCSFTANPSDNGTGLLSVRENTTVESYTFAPTNFRSSGNADLGLTGSRWGIGYFQNLNVTSSSGDAITVNDSAADGIQVVDWAASNAGLKLSVPSLSTTRGQICLNSTLTAMATAYSNASGGELAAYNNGGTIELWWHNGSSWGKIA